MNTTSYKQLISYLDSKATIKTTEQLLADTVGESYYRFTIVGTNMTADVTTVAGKATVIFSVDQEHKVLPIKSIAEHLDSNDGSIHRIILRVNNEIELLDENVGRQMMADAIVGSYPEVEGRSFKAVEYFKDSLN